MLPPAILKYFGLKPENLLASNPAVIDKTNTVKAIEVMDNNKFSSIKLNVTPTTSESMLVASPNRRRFFEENSLSVEGFSPDSTIIFSPTIKSSTKAIQWSMLAINLLNSRPAR